MNDEFLSRVHAYLDDELSPDEWAQFTETLKSDAQAARAFAAAALLHDQLRNHWSQPALELVAPASPTSAPRRGTSRRTWIALSVALCAALLWGLFYWQGWASRSASAADELERLIGANALTRDRTYVLAVEEIRSARQRGAEASHDSERRPPKPPLDGATLYLRRGGQFVLRRTTTDGLPFVTGSNGRLGWAASPDGPVRVSDDPTRFNHDLPGHEHALPLDDLQACLRQLRDAYNVQLLPIEGNENDEPAVEPLRLLVAVKRSGQRGPRRVEMTYGVASGLIQELRFVDMPYGPQRLTVRMTLRDERDLGASFFDPAAHHDPQRPVERED